MGEKTIEQVLRERTNKWMGIPGVEGTAIGLFQEEICIKILTSVDPKQLRSKIPETVEGYPVVIEETGTFQARDLQ